MVKTIFFSIPFLNNQYKTTTTKMPYTNQAVSGESSLKRILTWIIIIIIIIFNYYCYYSYFIIIIIKQRTLEALCPIGSKVVELPASSTCFLLPSTTAQFDPFEKTEQLPSLNLF